MAAGARWLLLAHQLPTRPSPTRVKTWRRLQHIAPLRRNSVYVLPNTPQCREDFEWIRSEIVAADGDATVFAADALNSDGDEAIETAFRKSREADYAELKREADQLLMITARKRRGTAALGREPLSRAVRLLRERLADIERIDFGRAPGRGAATEVLATLERRLVEYTRPPAQVATAQLPTADFRNRRWVTRPRPGVDRMASAWLIRRYIDPGAKFAFVDQPADADVPFDMYVGELSHQGSLCTFETLAQRFGLRGTAIEKIGQVVHDLDMKQSRYAAPEGPAVGRMVEGLRDMHADDHVLLEQGIAMFEALARSFDASVAARRPRRRVQRHKPSSRKRARR